MLNLAAEFQQLITALNHREIPYALCGGLAMAVYGYPRATIDIDLLVPEQHIAQLISVAEELGYGLETHLDALAAGEIRMTRVCKFSPTSEDFLALDVHATGPLDCIWAERDQIETDFGQIWILTRKALINMKRLRNSAQDQADIEHLEKGHI